MASTTQANGSATRRMNGKPIAMGGLESEIVQLNLDIKNAKHDRKNDSFHGDQLIGVRSDGSGTRSSTDKIPGQSNNTSRSTR